MATAESKDDADRQVQDHVCDAEIIAQWVCSHCTTANWDVKWACRKCLKPRGQRDWYYPARKLKRRTEDPQGGKQQPSAWLE